MVILLFLCALFASVGFFAWMLATNFFHNALSENQLYLVVPAVGLVGLFGIYGLLVELFTRKRSAESGLGRGAAFVTHLAAVPLVLKIVLGLFILPIVLPPVRRARTSAGVALRACAVWALVVGLPMAGIAIYYYSTRG